jgi:putative ABC transport system permease protein
LDNHLTDQAYYNIGSDIRLADLGQISERSNPAGVENGDSETTETSDQEDLRWLFLPVSEYLKVPGIQAATRVGDYTASTRLSGGYQAGTFIGLDRADFPEVAFWRWDFAPTYLGDLMNSLAITPDGILLPRTFMSTHTLAIGDTVQVNIDIYNQRVELQMKIVGSFDLFPTWYPETGPLFVGNLDHFFEQAAGQYPYNIWLKTEPGADQDQIIARVRNLGLRTLAPDAAFINIAQEQRRPERQGLFGLLSIGFGAAALLTVVGFILYTLFSFRQRFIELGILRAVGLSSGQMAIYLAWELAFLILTGLMVGTILGIWSSQLYIPYLQVGTELSTRTPSFLVEIAWPAIVRIYSLFGLLFIVALTILVILLFRMKIFQAVKLGETV